MLERLGEWSKRVHVPRVATAPLGFGTEYWDPDPTQYEGYEQLRERMAALGRTSTKCDLVDYLASHLLDDVIVAAGGVERAITKLREALTGLKDYVRDHGIKTKDGMPPVGLIHEAATEALYAFSEVLSWSRTVVERLERPPPSPINKKKFPKQGLIPALRPKRLRKRCENLFRELQSGPVAAEHDPPESSLFTAHYIPDPFSGVQVDSAGAIALPIPDAPIRRVTHWYLLTWNHGRGRLHLC